MKEWIVSIFSVMGAAFIGGIAGSFIAELLGYWHQPITGFVAAFTVIVIAYISAPEYKMLYTTVILAVGVLSAWQLMATSYYPESYKEKAYLETNIPIIATYIGALIAYFGCFLMGRKQNA